MSEKLETGSENPANRQHLCAKNVVHETWGKGQCLPEMHAIPDENGHVAWYDVMFEHGVEKSVMVEDLQITLAEKHTHSKKKMSEETLAESDYSEGDKVECIKSGMKGVVSKVDPSGTGAYYTVKREDGETMKYKPEELKAISEELDAVNPKALKKKFDDRKDKDIDNDGEVDSSDEYLHKRRKAVAKAMEKDDKMESYLKAISKSLNK